MDLPLAGVRALTAGAGVAGAYAGRLLARFGADVAIVEPPGGDPIRRLSPFPGDVPGPETGGWWLFLAAGLRSITLNLATPMGRRLLAGLPADVVLAPPSLLDALRHRPLVLLSPYGAGVTEGSALSTRPSDLALAAVGGWMLSSGEAKREPLMPPSPAVQVAAGLFAAIAALHLLRVGGAGRADLALAETVAATGIYETTAFSYRGLVRERTGPRYSSALVLNTTLRCADGFVGLHLNTQRQWKELCAMMDRPELADDPRFRTGALRAANVAELDAIVLPWAASRRALDLYHEGQRRRVPFSLIPRPSEVLASPQLAARGYFYDIAHPVAGLLRMPGAPFRFDGDTGRPGRAPLLGEHSASLLAEAGVAAGDMPRLRAAGVL